MYLGGFSLLLVCMSGNVRKALYSAGATALNRRVQGQYGQRYAGNPFVLCCYVLICILEKINCAAPCGDVETRLAPHNNALLHKL